MTAVRQWLRIVRLGLVQASIGAVTVFATSTLNRVMVVELALPAVLPGALIGIHYMVQVLRPRFGHGSDRGHGRTPWILGGMAVLSCGSVLATLAVPVLTASPVPGIALAVAGFVMVGVGVGAAGTSLLVLLAQEAGERRRATAAAVVWMMMIAGFIATAAVAGHMLAPFSIAALVKTALAIGSTALLVSVAALWGVERSQAPAAPACASARAAPAFAPALRDVWAEPQARRFTVFVFLSMLAYSAQELTLEPFAGTVFALSPAASAKLAGLQHTGVLGGMILVALLAGAVGGPRLGSMRLWTTGGCLASALAILGLAMTGLAESQALLHGVVVAVGVANGVFSIAAVASMMQLAGGGAGEGRRDGSRHDGVRMGLWGAAQAIAFAVGGVLGTGGSDVARHAFGRASYGYGTVFAIEAVLFGVAGLMAAVLFVPTRPAGRSAGSPAVLPPGAVPGHRAA